MKNINTSRRNFRVFNLLLVIIFVICCLLANNKMFYINKIINDFKIPFMKVNSILTEKYNDPESKKEYKDIKEIKTIFSNDGYRFEEKVGNSTVFEETIFKDEEGFPYYEDKDNLTNQIKKNYFYDENQNKESFSDIGAYNFFDFNNITLEPDINYSNIYNVNTLDDNLLINIFFSLAYCVASGFDKFYFVVNNDSYNLVIKTKEIYNEYNERTIKYELTSRFIFNESISLDSYHL